MTRVERWWLPCAAAVMLWGCSSDDGGKGKPCPEGVVAGKTTACSCDDGTMSTATCQDDKTLTACDCADGGSGAGGAGGSAGVGGSGGAVSTAGAGGAGGKGGSGGSGGAGGAAGSTQPADDGGMPPASDGGMEPEPTPVKTDGTMFALCADGTECGFELDCYGALTGGGFCTTLCTEDADCETVGADFTCSSMGMCRQSCTGLDDDSCTHGLKCTLTGGFPGGGGGGAPMPTFACTLGPNAGQPAAEAFGRCMGDQACGGGGMTCVGDNMMMMTPGFCSGACMDDTDCSDLTVDSGNLEPTCEFTGGGFTSSCALNCDGADAECPDGMTCRVSMGPNPSICSYE